MNLKLDNVVLIIATLSSFFTVFLSSALTIAVPSIASEFSMNNILQNWVTMVFFFVIAIFTVPVGQISGKYGLKKSMVVATLLYIIGAVVAIFSMSSEIFFISRIIQGIGGAFLSVASMALVVSAFKPQERGKAIGITVTGVYLATSLSPVIGGFLNHTVGWRSIFVFTIPFLVLILVLLITKVNKEWNSLKDTSIDWKGSAVYSIGIVLFIYGFTILNETLGVILTVLGLITLAIFVAIELKVKYPVFDVKLFKNSEFASANFAAVCAYLASFSLVTILNYHLQYIRGFDSQLAGIFLLAAPLIQVIVAPYAGKLSDKVNPQKLSALGIGIAAVAIGLLAMLDSSTPLWLLIFALALEGLGFGIFSSPNTSAIMGAVPPKDTPTASASVSTMRVIGQSMSMGMLTLVFAFVMGNVPIIPKYFSLLIASSQITCFICMVLCIVSVVASLIGIKSKKIVKG